MTAAIRTPQRLDPLGTLSAWPLVPVIGAVIFVYSLYSTLAHLDQLTNPVLAWTALGLMTGVSVFYSVRARSEQAPFSRLALVIIVVLALAAGSMFTLSVWGANHLVQDDWSQIAIALTLSSLALFRPVGEVIVSAIVAAAVVGTSAELEDRFLAIDTQPLVYATVTATPVLALALAGCAYAWAMTGDVLRWGDVAREAQGRLEPEMREAAARSIHQESVTLLNSATVPFFVEVLERDELTVDDIARARSIAAVLRRGAVDDVDRGWLEETIARSVAGASPSSVSDPERIAASMTEEQRGIVGAILASLSQFQGFDPQSLTVELTRGPGAARACIDTVIDARRRDIRREFLPYLSAFRAVTRDATLAARNGSMTIQFYYGES